MKHGKASSLLVLIIVLTCAAAPGAPSQLAGTWNNIEGAWLFRTDPHDVGEGKGWASPGHDDSSWRTITVPGYWEEQGVTDPRPGRPPQRAAGVAWTDYDGVAWYRLHVVIPSAWAGKDLVLSLGSVDDEDRTYFNGRLVGATGPGLKQAVLAWRAYSVAAAMVRPGRDNVLAIRVTDGGGPGGIMGPSLWLLPKDIAEKTVLLPASDRPLAERFADPPAASRILKIVHAFPDDPTKQDMLIRSLVSQGFGGVVTNVSFTDYLESEKKWRAFAHWVNEARKVGMALWLYDEHGYPSGTAGGITLRGHPEWEASGLLIADVLVREGKMTLEVPPGELVLAAAYPVREGAIVLDQAVDLSQSVRNRKVSWRAPEGSWRVMAVTRSRLYEGTHAALSLAEKLPYINLLMGEPTERFIEVTHERYAARLSDDLSEWFIATFTDEPSLMSMFMKPQPFRVLPWAPNLAGEFRKRRGYELAPLIPALAVDAGLAGKSARYDFWLTVSELVSENYFGRIEDWCREHNIASGGHLLYEEDLLAHVSLYGDFFRCVRRLGAPSIDCLTSIPEQVPWFIARLASSAAELEGNTVTMCETSDFAQVYRPVGDSRPARIVTEDEIRGTCNRLISNGITTITSYYSFRGLANNRLVRLNEWVGRCTTMLAGGRQRADIALLYPVESVWPRFRASRHRTDDCPPGAHLVARTWRAAAESLYAARRDFTFVDSRTLQEGKVRDGVLSYGQLQWRVVVLPCADTLPLAAWENLARFRRSGGVVIALGYLPANSEKEFPSPRVQAIADEMFGDSTAGSILANDAGGAGVFLPTGSEFLLATLLDALLEVDVRIADADAPIRVTHRRIDGHEVYFLTNDNDKPWSGDVALAVTGAGEEWDPATGKMTPLASGEGIGLELRPYGGMLFRFGQARSRPRLRVESGRLPGLTFAPLPEAGTSVVKGEFVKGSVTPDAAHSKGQDPAWRATGILTKGDVDTFLFAMLTYPEALDLEDVVCLDLETWVPEGQNASTQLLIILWHENGSQYFAQMGRSLNLSGYSRCLVPLSQFQPAPWGANTKGGTDLKAIRAIAVGWGGYFGAKGEKVEFSFRAPGAGRKAR